jgi:hypothetical protein
MLFFKKFLFTLFVICITFTITGCFKKQTGPQKMDDYVQKNYHSEKHSFSLSFPDNWLNNFSILEEKQNDIEVISFVYNQLPGQEYPIFRLVVYPFETWQEYKNKTELILNQEVFAYTNEFVFVLVRTLDNPYSSPQMEQFITLNRGVEDILKSFKISEGNEFKLNKIKVYFSNIKENPEMLDCRLSFPTERTVEDGFSYEEQSLKALFSGPTDEEVKNGFQSFFSSSTVDILKSVEVVENIALINLKDFRSLIPNANSSCGSSQFLSEIENTLKQFPHVYQVYMAINEDPNTIYEWLQLGCTENNFYCDKTPFNLTKEIDGSKIETPLVPNATTAMEDEKVATTTKNSDL